jgi:hypothetical protein
MRTGADMTRFTAKLELLLLVALSAGCTTMETGNGWTSSEAEPIDFSWERSSSVPAAMSSPLLDERHYNGQLFQIRINSPPDGTEPLWSVRFPGWSEHHWDAAPSRSLSDRDTGPTVADSRCGE